MQQAVVLSPIGLTGLSAAVGGLPLWAVLVVLGASLVLAIGQATVTQIIRLRASNTPKRALRLRALELQARRARGNAKPPEVGPAETAPRLERAARCPRHELDPRPVDTAIGRRPAVQH
ncbi:MAG: hypothetical protein AB7V44_06410 [Pseudonocardia sp.]